MRFAVFFGFFAKLVAGWEFGIERESFVVIVVVILVCVIVVFFDMYNCLFEGAAVEGTTSW
jgi:dolichyl-phosphate-mannose--protein O-mannosyl transferase